MIPAKRSPGPVPVPSLEELAAGLFNDSVVLQPTTICNLNCRYCYLPERRSNSVMPVEVPRALAQDLASRSTPTKLLWHGGEPLATGVDRLEKLLEPFESLRERGLIKHTMQTNGTLLDRRWARLLRRFDFSIGVSVDGPGDCNDSRLTWSGERSLPAVLKGLDAARAEGVPFGMIMVISPANVGRAREIYNFVADLGCRSVGINIEEVEGLNRLGSIEGDAVSKFWIDLLDAWLERPTTEVREFRQALGWTKGVLEGHAAALGPRRRELYPTVSWQGDVVMLSPEFIGAPIDERKGFVVGNVLRTPLSELCERAKTEVGYVRDFLRGVQRCSAECTYFSYCRGGTASNKYFETGSVNATETKFCRNTKQRLMDAVLSRAQKEAIRHVPDEERAGGESQ